MESQRPENHPDTPDDMNNESNYIYDEKVKGVEHFDQLIHLPRDVIVDEVVELKWPGNGHRGKVFIIRQAAGYRPLFHVLVNYNSNTYNSTIQALNLSCSQTLFSCNYAVGQISVVSKHQGSDTEPVGLVSDGIDDVNGIRYMNVQDFTEHAVQGSRRKIEHVIDFVRRDRGAGPTVVFSSLANLRQNITFSTGLDAATIALITVYGIKNNSLFTSHFGHQCPVLDHEPGLLSNMAKWVPKSLKRVTPFDMPPFSNNERSTRVDSDDYADTADSAQPEFYTQRQSATTQQSTIKHPISQKTQPSRVHNYVSKIHQSKRKTQQLGLKKKNLSSKQQNLSNAQSTSKALAAMTQATKLNPSTFTFPATFSIRKLAENQHCNSHYYIIIDDKTEKVIYTVECSKTRQEERVIVWNTCVPETPAISSEYCKGSRRARVVVDQREIGNIDFDGICNFKLNETLKVTSYYKGDYNHQSFIIQRAQERRLTLAVISFVSTKAKISVRITGDWSTEWKGLLAMFALSTIGTYRLYKEPVAQVSSLRDVTQLIQDETISQDPKVVERVADVNAGDAETKNLSNTQPKDRENQQSTLPFDDVYKQKKFPRELSQSPNAQSVTNSNRRFETRSPSPEHLKFKNSPTSSLPSVFRISPTNSTHPNSNGTKISSHPKFSHSPISSTSREYKDGSTISNQEMLNNNHISPTTGNQTRGHIPQTAEPTNGRLDVAETTRRIDLLENSLTLTIEDIAIHQGNGSSQTVYGVVRNYPDGLPLAFTRTNAIGDMVVSDLNFSQVLFAADNCHSDDITSMVYPTADWRHRAIDEFGSVHKRWIRNVYGRKILDVLANGKEFHLKGVGEECGDASLSLVPGTNRIRIAQHKWLKKKHKFLVLCCAKKLFAFGKRELKFTNGSTKELMEIVSW